MTAARLTVLDASVLERLRTEQLRDAIDDAAPHALVATSVGARNRLRASPAVPEDLPILLVANAGPDDGNERPIGDDRDSTDDGEPVGDRSTGDGPPVHRFGDVAVAVATSDAALAAIDERLDGAEIGASHAYVLTDRLSLSIRPTELTTAIDGLESYRAALERDGDRAGEEGAEVTSEEAAGEDCAVLPFDEVADDLHGDAGERTRADAADPRDGEESRDDVTHVSTALPADYCAVHDGLTLRGASPTDEERDAALGGGAGEPAIVTLALGPDGAVGTREVGPDALGLRAVRDVGRKRADALRSAGIETRTDLASADLAALADVDGIGRGTAQRLREHASAHEAGHVVRRGDATLPDREPVFVDVETDGLSPSIVWLIGVLDRQGEERYMSFLARDPDEPGEALAAFCSWYVANASDRPIVAYNGWSFDFPVIERQIERHCPEYLADWQSAWRVDPYAWAVGDGNAVLPGRTNALEDVAAALGYESEADGSSEEPPEERGAPKPLTGAEVGRRYRRWIRERTADAEPDWARLEAYCEDDVRALAHVWDALRDASRRAGAGGSATAAAGDATAGSDAGASQTDGATTDASANDASDAASSRTSDADGGTDEQTTQGRLSDFG